MRVRWGQGGRRGFAAVPAWTLATVLSMVVATAGIQEIAARVASPLNLDGRAPGDEGPFAALTLAEREGTGRFDPPPAVDVPATPAVAGSVGALEPDRDPLPTGAGADPILAVAPSASDAWTITTDEPRTRWAPHDGGHRLEYLGADGWTPGYDSNASTTLTSPWMDVTAGVPLFATFLAAVSIEPELDGALVAWTADGLAWQDLTLLSGGNEEPTLRRKNLAIGVVDAERIRLRFHFTSDPYNSTADRDRAPVLVGDHEGLAIRGVAIATRPVGTQDLGIPEPPPAGPASPHGHTVVGIGVSDGINPYHLAFRDPDPRSWSHPSTYLPGYPQDAPALWLSLEAPTWEAAVAADAKVWADVLPGVTYWIPGTRIVAARAGTGTKSCCLLASGPGEHFGTSALSNAAGADFGGCADCLIAYVQGTSDEDVAWVADQPWVDVYAQTVWSYAEADTQGGYASHDTLRPLADSHLLVTPTHVVTNQDAVADTPVVALAHVPAVEAVLSVPGAVVVGAHRAGDAMPTGAQHLVAPACGRQRALSGTLDGTSHDSGGPRTGAAWQAGVLAEALRRVRDAFGARQGGGGVALVLTDPGVGVLDDGRLTNHELRDVLLRAATPRPEAGPRGSCGDRETIVYEGVPVPGGAPTWPFYGYGAFDDEAVERAVAHLVAGAPLPAREEEARWFGLMERIQRRGGPLP